MYLIELHSLTLKVYDDKNQQHKIFEVVRPINGTDFAQIWDAVESRVAILPWLSNRVFRKIKVEQL